MSPAQAMRTVYFIRHGEKPQEGNGLNAQGIQRAQYIRKLFGPDSEYKIDYILAQRPKKNGAQGRPFDTVRPLAEDLGLAVDTGCGRDDFDAVTTKIKQYTGSGNILVCWEHKRLTDLAVMLGVHKPPRYPTDRYDIIWTCEKPYDTISESHQMCPGLDVS